jgi:hypothetical protein
MAEPAAGDGRATRIQETLEVVTRKWWFFLAMLILQVLAVLPFASRNFSLSSFVEIAEYSLGYSFIGRIGESVYPIFKVIPFVLIVSIIFLKNRVTRLFSLYVGVSYLIFAVVQNVAITEKYGLSFITVNVVMFTLVGLSWFWEAIVGKDDFERPPTALWRYWVVLPAILAFWTPGDPATGMPDFDPAYFVTQDTGLAFCLMTPVYLAVVSLYHPGVNLVTMRITGVVGLILGMYNMFFIFGMKTASWYVGVLHLPLVILSAYALVLSLGKAGRASEELQS